MLRIVLGLIVIAAALALAIPLVRYGTLDPCRMLAKDMAHDMYAPLARAAGTDPGDVPEPVERSARLLTSQYSQGTCLAKLKDRWLGLEDNAAQ